MKVGVSKSNLHKTLMELIDKQLARLKYLRGQKKLISQNFAKITFSLSASILPGESSNFWQEILFW